MAVFRRLKQACPRHTPDGGPSCKSCHWSSWTVVVRVPQPGQKRAKQVWRSGFATRPVAEQFERDALTAREKGRSVLPDKVTVRDYMARWLEHHRHNVRPTTWKRYVQLVESDIVPVIGDTRLDRVRPVDVQLVLDKMRGRGLAPRTIVQTRAIMGVAFKQAVAWELRDTNPVASVRRPKTERAQLKVPDGEGLRALQMAARGTLWEPAVLLATSTGARRGEVLAIRWSDVDLATGRLTITRALQRVDGELIFVEPKTSRARRTITLPSSAVEALRQFKRQQAARRLELGGWNDHDLIVERGDGAPVDPDAFTHGFMRCAKQAGLEGVRLHDVRHGVATQLLARGVHPGIASAVLGHASPAFTMSVYQHVLDGMTDQAAVALEAALEGPVEPLAGTHGVR